MNVAVVVLVYNYSLIVQQISLNALLDADFSWTTFFFLSRSLFLSLTIRIRYIELVTNYNEICIYSFNKYQARGPHICTKIYTFSIWIGLIKRRNGRVSMYEMRFYNIISNQSIPTWYTRYLQYYTEEKKKGQTDFPQRVHTAAKPALDNNNNITGLDCCRLSDDCSQKKFFLYTDEY